MPEKSHVYGLYVHYVVHICDFGMLRVNNTDKSKMSLVSKDCCRKKQGSKRFLMTGRAGVVLLEAKMMVVCHHFVFDFNTQRDEDGLRYLFLAPQGTSFITLLNITVFCIYRKKICVQILKVLGKSVGLCKTSKRKDQLYISLLVSVWRIICENFNPNGLILAEI